MPKDREKVLDHMYTLAHKALNTTRFKNGVSGVIKKYNLDKTMQNSLAENIHNLVAIELSNIIH